MKDRTFAKLEFTCLTQAPNSSDGNFEGYGMLISQTEGPNGSELQQFIFSPAYPTDSNTYTGILPGNSLMVGYRSTASAFVAYADSYAQGYPTGLDQWAQFYSRVIVHGSAVQVTLCNCDIPGQLVVVPVILFSTTTPAYTWGTQMTGSNWNSLVSFSTLPDEQPYKKIKYVSASGGMDKVIIKHKMLTKKLLDIKTLKDDSQNEAIINSNGSFVYTDPTINQWGWYIAFVPTQAITVTDSGDPTASLASIQVKITYFCEFNERINIHIHKVL